jgi:hypothetical protein
MLKFGHYKHTRIIPEDLLIQLLSVRSSSFLVLACVDFTLYRGNYGYGFDEWPLQPMHRLVALCEREGLESHIFSEISLAET